MIDPEVRARLDHHILAAQAVLFNTIKGGIFEVAEDWALGFSGLRGPHFNMFLPLTPAGLNDDSLADAAAYFFERRVYYSVTLIHDRFPHGPDFLDRRGYQPLPPEPAMYLCGPPTDVWSVPGVSVQRVRTVPALSAFCTVLHRVFDFPLEDMVRKIPVNHLKNEFIQHYLAFVDDQPVGAGTLVCAEDASSIWNLCTLDGYRNRGVAKTLLSHMLGDAAEQRCGLTMLYSTAQAYHLFSRFGFEIFTQRQAFLPPGIVYTDE
ncbi:MAG: N-acetyltransferase [Chloroflexi bacterium]|nr:MAG: N-acetyltransferase [Chloroflexota bacterium]